MTWYFDDSLIDDSYFSEQRGLSRNELQLSHLNRTHLNSQLTCRSQNSNLTKATQTTLSIDFIRKYSPDLFGRLSFAFPLWSSKFGV